MARRWSRTQPLTARTTGDQIRRWRVSGCLDVINCAAGSMALCYACGRVVWRLWCGGASVHKCSKLFITSSNHGDNVYCNCNYI